MLVHLVLAIISVHFLHLEVRGPYVYEKVLSK